jgi:IS30 family transposase
VLYAVEKGAIANRVSIRKRPEEVADRVVPGHWEGDTVESKKRMAGLNTLVERTSGIVFISKLRDHTSAATTEVVIRRLQRIPRRLRKTLTLDNGPENARHELVTKCTGAKCFFANPYHFWERGTNENTNGLIRWYLPKGTDLSSVPESAIQEIEYELNTRPRKRLGWKTPLEVFNSFLLH